MEAVRLENVSFQYTGENRKNGIKNISMSVKEGECVLLTGISGCGKSTILRVINGLAPYFYEGEITGKIELMGKQTDEIPFAEISKICGSVFQNPRSQFFYMNTSSEIAFGCENQGIPTEEIEARVADCVEQFQLEDLQNRNIMQLSGGEKQKIAFASVYATNPDIFVLDEPSSNLDFHSVLELKKLIEKIKQQGKTIIIAEHRLWYLTDVADRVILMQDGQIFKNMSIQDFCRLPVEQLQNMGLRCRNLSEIKTNTNDKKFSQHTLELKDIHVKYGEKIILKNISFTANGGEIVAITGANGTGKTTLARTICGLIKQKSGNIFIDDRSLPAKSRIKKSYMVMQDVGHQLFTDCVETECTLGTKTTNKPVIDETLSMLSLSELKNRHPLSLSGGQKQRLAVAISLLCDKEILIFDEPTSGLDLKSMREVGTMIERLSEQEKILIVITHDIEFIKTICSRVLMLSSGKIIADLRGEEKKNIENYILAGGDFNEE